MGDSEAGELLRQLIRFQEISTEITRLRGKVDETPRLIAELERILQEEQASFEEAKQSIEAAARDRRMLEREAEALREKLANYKDRLMTVKTNTEYQAMLHEISYVEGQILEKEDAILEKMVESETLDEEIRELERDMEAKQAEVDGQRHELERSVGTSRAELEKLMGEQATLEGELPLGFLERYKRIAAVRGGIALAAIQGQTCQACHVRLRPQLVAEVKGNRAIILCENCNRILYYAAGN